MTNSNEAQVAQARLQAAMKRVEANIAEGNAVAKSAEKVIRDEITSNQSFGVQNKELVKEFGLVAYPFIGGGINPGNWPAAVINSVRKAKMG